MDPQSQGVIANSTFGRSIQISVVLWRRGLLSCQMQTIGAVCTTKLPGLGYRMDWFVFNYAKDGYRPWDFPLASKLFRRALEKAD